MYMCRCQTDALGVGGIPLTQPLFSGLGALCLPAWPAFWTVSLDLKVSIRRYDGFSAAVDANGSN